MKRDRFVPTLRKGEREKERKKKKKKGKEKKNLHVVIMYVFAQMIEQRVRIRLVGFFYG